METSYVIVGGGGHALSVADALLRLELPLLGFTDPREQGELAAGIPWLGTDQALQKLPSAQVCLVSGLGSVGAGMAGRREPYLRLRDQGFRFAGVVHPDARISPLQSRLGPAHQVMSAAVVNAGVQLGENVLINSAAVIEHGCHIGNHCHVASGAVLCGDVRLEDGVHVGAGATVIQGIRIGSGAVIAAGAVVAQNVEPLTLVAGVPGKVKRKIET